MKRLHRRVAFCSHNWLWITALVIIVGPQSLLGQPARAEPSAPLIPARMWHFEALMPDSAAATGVAGIALSTESVHLRRWQLKAGSASAITWLELWPDCNRNVLALPVRSFDPVTDVATFACDAGDCYGFFGAATRDALLASPVMHAERRAWSWQSNDSVPTSVRKRVGRMLLETCQVFAMDGHSVGSFPDVAGYCSRPNSGVDLGWTLTASDAIGFVGVLPPNVTVESVDDLEYTDVLICSQARSARVVSSARKLLVSSSDLQSVDAFTAADMGGDLTKCELRFGRPACTSPADPAYLWVELTSSSDSTERLFGLVKYAGSSVSLVCGYVMEGVNITKRFDGHAWFSDHVQVSWILGTSLPYGVNPLVGVSSRGDVIAYSPGQIQVVGVRGQLRPTQ